MRDHTQNDHHVYINSRSLRENCHPKSIDTWTLVLWWLYRAIYIHHMRCKCAYNSLLHVKSRDIVARKCHKYTSWIQIVITITMKIWLNGITWTFCWFELLCIQRINSMYPYPTLRSLWHISFRTGLPRCKVIFRLPKKDILNTKTAFSKMVSEQTSRHIGQLVCDSARHQTTECPFKSLTITKMNGSNKKVFKLSSWFSTSVVNCHDCLNSSVKSAHIPVIKPSSHKTEAQLIKPR